MTQGKENRMTTKTVVAALALLVPAVLAAGPAEG